MRTALILPLLALWAGSASADMLPRRINFQGKLLDSNNSPRNGSFNMQFRIYEAPTGGTALYTEPASGWRSVAVTNGVFAVQIGSEVALSPNLFAGASAYLGVTVQPDGEMLPRQNLVMSPYAFTAAQLAQTGDIRVNAGTTYSTFSSAGNLILAYGVSGATAVFSGALSAGNLTSAYGVSGATAVFSGALSAGDLISVYGVSGATAAFNGALTASSGTFTASGLSQYSLQTSSGILVQNGTLRVDGKGGADVLYGLKATTVTLRGAAGDPAGPVDGMEAYNTTTNKFRCYENGAWRDCLRRSMSISLGGYAVLTNVGASYDAIAISSGLGTAFVDFAGSFSVDMYVRVNKIGTGTQSWQLWDATDGAQIGVISDAGAAGMKTLSTNIAAGLPTTDKLIRIRAQSTNANDDPVYFGATIKVNY